MATNMEEKRIIKLQYKDELIDIVFSVKADQTMDELYSELEHFCAALGYHPDTIKEYFHPDDDLRQQLKEQSENQFKHLDHLNRLVDESLAIVRRIPGKKAQALVSDLIDHLLEIRTILSED